ncbi:MAG: squalene synthase HpnC [Candidatus Tectimicrobiota bacterium]
MVKRHYENFPVASRLLPAGLRRELTVVYAFARLADDFADEEAYDDETRLTLLKAWGAELDRCVSGRSEHPVFVALGDLLRRRALSPEPFHRLLRAFRLDCTQKRYPDWEALFAYCRCSANPVGHIVLALADYGGEPYEGPSDAICTALQLANFWQDVRSDLGRGRVYIPEVELRRFGVDEAALAAPSASPHLRGCLAACVGRTEELFDAGEALFAMVDRTLAFHLRLVLLGGRRVLEKIARQDYDVLGRRPTLGRLDWAWVLIQAARALRRA